MEEEMKRICSVSFALLILAVTFMSCGGKSSTAGASQSGGEKSPAEAALAFGDPNAPVTATIWTAMYGSGQKTEWYSPEAPGMKRLEEKTGVRLNWQVVAGGTTNQAYEVFNLMMASGDVPDIVMINIQTQLKRYPQAWFPLDTIAKGNPRYPNFNKYVLEDELLQILLNDEEGHERYVPCLATRRQGDILLLRRDLLEKYGEKEPVTLEDWHRVLTKARADGKKPYVTRYGRGGIFRRLLAGYIDCIHEDYFVEDGKVKYGIFDPRFKEAVEIARQWYSEGLIDQEYPTTEGTRWWEGVLRGEVFATHDNTARIGGADQEFINQGVPYRIVGVGPMQSPRTGLRRTNNHYPKTRERSVGINIKTARPDRLLDLFEYCYSDEGFILMNYGIEGLSFYYDEKGNPISDPEYGLKVEKGELPHVLTTLDMPKNQRNELLTGFLLDREDHALVREATALYTNNDFIQENWMSSIVLTEDERNTLSPINAELDTYRSEWLDKFIIGAEPMSKWDDFAAQIQKMNVQQGIDIYQTALNRTLGK
jgi:putative aldouronate transport system substrate-binding protein